MRFMIFAATTMVLLVKPALSDPIYSSLDVPNSFGTYPQGVSSTGDVTGTYKDTAGRDHGFLWHRETGKYSLIDWPSAETTYPISVSRGEVTGYYEEDNQTHGFVRVKNGGLISIDPSDSVSTIPNSISDGWIAGTYTDTSGLKKAFVRDLQGNFAVVSIAGASATFGNGVNSKGAMTGIYYGEDNIAHGFLRDTMGVITTFDVPSQHSASPINIANDGTITGTISGIFNYHEGSTFSRSKDGSFTFYHEKKSSNVFGMSKTYAAGEYNTHSCVHSFLSDLTGETAVFDPPDSDCSYAVGVNTGGVVTGVFYPKHGDYALGYLRTP